MNFLLNPSRPLSAHERFILSLGGAALLLGLGLIWAGVVTPPYTDADAFSEAYTYGDTKGFFAAVHQYSTKKFDYADLGYLLTAWGALTVSLMILGKTRGWSNFLIAARSWKVILPLTALSLLGIWAGLIASIFHEFERFQVPPWADSIGIPLGLITVFMIGFAILVLPFILVPLFLRRSPAGLFQWKQSRVVAAVTVAAYALPIAAGLVIAVAGSMGGGGYATSIAGALLTWLLLNAVAIIGGETRQ